MQWTVSTRIRIRNNVRSENMEILSNLFPVLYVSAFGLFIIIFIKKVRYGIDDKAFKMIIEVLIPTYIGSSLYLIFKNVSPLITILAILELIIFMIVIGFITNDNHKDKEIYSESEDEK